LVDLAEVLAAEWEGCLFRSVMPAL
jgi:hypothetical protein